MVKTEEVSVGQGRYKITQLPSTKARRVLVRVFKVMGPAFGSMLDEATVKGGKVADIGGRAIGAILRELSLSLDGADLEAVLEDLLFSNHCEFMRRSDKGDGWIRLTQALADEEFAGRTDELLQLLGHGLRVNFAGFFTEGGILGQFIQSQNRSPEPSPSSSGRTSTGSSGDSPPPTT